MYTEILNIMLNDVPKYDDTFFESLKIQTKGDIVINFCRKYPWAIDPNFLKENNMDISPLKTCLKIENLMSKGDWQALHRELLPNIFYPTNYWEKLAHLTHQNVLAAHVFVDVMINHGFKFTPGVRDKLLLHSPLQPHTKTIIIHKINSDIANMYNSLFT
jgi:hypothetical protein